MSLAAFWGTIQSSDWLAESAEGPRLRQDELRVWKKSQEEEREGRDGSGRGRTALAQEARAMGSKADGEKGEGGQCGRGKGDGRRMARGLARGWGGSCTGPPASQERPHV